jgi:serine O-acetyltransferase
MLECADTSKPSVALKATSLTRMQLILEDLSCVPMRDPAARGRLETLLTYPGVHAVIWHRLANWLWRNNHHFPARLISWFARFLTNVDIHPGATIGRRFFIDHGAGVVIGETAVVGDDVTIYHGVTLGGVSWSPGKRHPTVEDGVIIGAGAKILGPITIGRNARVGANSVVIESVTRDATVVGIPAKIVHRELARRTFGGRINLNHHLMPDPVGEAFAALVDRVEFLETRLSHLQRRLRDQAIPVKDEAANEKGQSRFI